MKRLLGIFIILYIVSVSTTIFAQTPDPTFAPLFGGALSSGSQIIKRADGKLVISGGFQLIGGVRRNLIAIFDTDGTIDASFDIGDPTSFFPQVSSQTDSKLIVNGITHINGIARKSPVRLNVDGSVDESFNVGQGANSTISHVIAMPDGKILVGGDFSAFNGQSVPPLIRLNADGSRDTNFFAVINGFQVASSVVQPDGKIIAIGEIYSIQNGQFQGIVRLNVNGSIDNTFNPGGGFNNLVATIALQSDGKILTSGNFVTYDGITRRGMARINADGSLDTSFNAEVTTVGGVTVTVTYCIQSNGQVIIGGSFDFVNGTPRKRIARLNSEGSLDQSFSPIVDEDSVSGGSVSPALVLPDQTILITGSFFSINQIIRLSAAKITPLGTLDPTFNLNPQNIASVLTATAQQDGKMLIGGSFSHVNGSLNFGLARINSDGSLDSAFNSGAGLLDVTTNGGYALNAITVQGDGKILIGGSFRTYNGILRPNLARLNSDGTLDATLPNLATVGTVTDIIVQPDSKILVIGGIRRFNPDGTADTNFNVGSGPNNSVNKAVLLPDGKIIIGGTFTSFNGTSRTAIARLNPNGSLDNTFTASITGTNISIASIALQNDGKLLIGGNFSSVNGIARNRIARLNSNGTIDESFNPGTGADSTVNTIRIQPNGKILLGGRFVTYAGLSKRKLVQVLADGSPDNTFGTDLNWTPAGTTAGANISILLQTSSGIFAGGFFSKLNDKNLASFTKFTFAKQTPFDFDGDSKTDISIFRPNLGQWWTSRSSDGQVPALAFGTSTDTIVPADYTGDGKSDIAFWRPSTGQWFVLRSEDSSFYALPFGANGDVPVPADYDADGKADLAVFRPSNSTWFVSRSGDNGTTIQGFGIAGDVPVAADYDGDGKADIAIYRPNAAGGAQWWIQRSMTGVVAALQFGTSTDKTVPGDYTGDGKADIAFFRPSTGFWNVLRSEDLSYFAFPFGTTGDVPVPGDYDGDGKFDAGVFRPSNSTWYVQRSTAGTLIQQFGITGDLPLPNAYVR